MSHFFKYDTLHAETQNISTLLSNYDITYKMVVIEPGMELTSNYRGSIYCMWYLRYKIRSLDCSLTIALSTYSQYYYLKCKSCMNWHSI